MIALLILLPNKCNITLSCFGLTKLFVAIGDLHVLPNGHFSLIYIGDKIENVKVIMVHIHKRVRPGLTLVLD